MIQFWKELQEQEKQLEKLDHVPQYSANDLLKTGDLYRVKKLSKAQHLEAQFDQEAYFEKLNEVWKAKCGLAV